MNREVSFIVQTVDCIACSPMFRRFLLKIPGVIEVKELPITNRIIVVYDEEKLRKDELMNEIKTAAGKGGLAGRIIFVNR